LITGSESRKIAPTSPLSLVIQQVSSCEESWNGTRGCGTTEKITSQSDTSTMSIESVSQTKIDELLSMQKRVTNPSARVVSKGQHQQINYQVKGTDDTLFSLYWRQNTNIPEDFSCGLSWDTPSGEVLTLVRYNGPSHPHTKTIEGQKLDFVCHIHRATKRYVDAGKKPEGYAEETAKYQTLRGALHCLVSDCNISGIQTIPDHPNLF
jgi:hypothetical protein